jgi:hypothetical protein
MRRKPLLSRAQQHRERAKEHGVYQDEVDRRLAKNLLNAPVLIGNGFDKQSSHHMKLLIQIR